MALTAKFVTDFNAFYDAVQKAKVSLTGFNKEAEAVGSSLSAMADQFSGKKILEEGAQIARLFQTVEDVSLLTTNELKALGGTVDEIIEKMERLGIAVPENLRMISTEAKKVTTETQSLSDWASTALGTFTGRLAERALDFIIDLGKEVLATADHLQQLADKTGIATDEIQQLEGVGNKAGVSIDTISNAILTLQERVATGDKNAIWALKELGITVKDFQTMEPGQVFIQMIDALHNIEDPLRRTRIESELWGKTWKDMAPLVKQGAGEIADGVITMSTRSVSAIDDFGDKLGQWWTNMKAIFGESLADVLTLSLSKTRELQSEFDKLGESAKRNLSQPFMPEGVIPPGLPDDLAAIEQGFDRDAEAIKRAAKASEDWKRANEEMQGVGRNVYETIDGINGAVVEAIKFYSDLGISTKTLADWYGLTETQVKAVMQAMKEHLEIVEKLAKVEQNHAAVSQSMFGAATNAELDYVKAYSQGYDQIAKMQQQTSDAIMKATLSETDYKIAKIREWQAETIKAFTGTKDQLAQFTAAVQTEADRQIAALKGTTDMVVLIGKSAAEVEAERQKAAKQTGDAVTDEYRRQQEAFMNFKGIVVAGTQEMVGATYAVQTAMQGTDTVMRDWAIRQAQMERGEIFLTGMSSGRIPIQTRQAGGPVEIGRTYLVGERGPELFRPAAAGNILPTAAGGGITMHNTFNVNGSIRDLARPLMDELSRLMKQTRQWPSAT